MAICMNKSDVLGLREVSEEGSLSVNLTCMSTLHVIILCLNVNCALVEGRQNKRSGVTKILRFILGGQQISTVNLKQ